MSKASLIVLAEFISGLFGLFAPLCGEAGDAMANGIYGKWHDAKWLGLTYLGVIISEWQADGKTERQLYVCAYVKQDGVLCRNPWAVALRDGKLEFQAASWGEQES